METPDPMSIETSAHVVEVSEGYLTIDTKRFPDDCVCLTPQEVEAMLKLLLVWRWHMWYRSVSQIGLKIFRLGGTKFPLLAWVKRQLKSIC